MDRREIYKAIVLFGMVSLLGDIIYEGARGVAPSYLQFLGASALIVGLTFGLGEFLGLALRLLSGIVADATRAYWPLYAMGYGLLITIPFLGLAYSWPIAVALILVERIAKAVRSPARDTLLSVVSHGVGAGKAFGLHELMDQIGAALGPAALGLILLWSPNNYFQAFSLLFIPYIILILLVFRTFKSTRKYTVDLEVRESRIGIKELSSNFWWYTLAVGLNTLGLIHVSLIVFRASQLLQAWGAAFLYVLIQGVDAVVAPISGVLYDKLGRKVLFIPFIMSIFPSILVLLGRWDTLLLGAIIFGAVYGMQESIYRAAISGMVPTSARGSAYGIFNTVYGLGFLVSGLAFGSFIEGSLVWIGAIYAVMSQIVAVIVLTKSFKIH